MIIQNQDNGTHPYSGRAFFVRVVFQGERYGLNDMLTHEDAEPYIEFYDWRHAGSKFGPRGQFVTRYYAGTLAAHRFGQGLDLLGHEPAWKVDAHALCAVIETAKALMSRVSTGP